ncbi:MAG: LuxR C-terminal-related transcriptional regulator, partial [Saprospiraceae bacterium]|nr:LuxR C-terminal-related transcriptional regulator [Saprospiraceae bacterium]
IDIAEVLHNKYQIPYIFLTLFSDEKTLNSAQEMAPYGYLVKPFQDQSLISTITIAWSNWQRSLHKTINSELIAKKSLTDQEQVITGLLAKGHSYKTICEKLFISMNTLKYHAKNIYSKFDVKGRSELTAHLYQ